MKLIKFIAAAAISAAFAAPASAGVLAAADLTIKQLVLLGTNGNPLGVSQVTIIGESRTGNASADFNNVSVSAGNGSASGSGATLDLSPACSGPSCASINAIYGSPVNTNFTTHLTNPVGNFALADMKINGSAVDGSGAAGVTRADVSISSAGVGGANTTIQNVASAVTGFQVTNTITARFAINYDLFVNAFVSPFVPVGTGMASATVSYGFTLKEDGVTVLSQQNGFSDLSKLSTGASSINTITNSSTADSGVIFSNFMTFTKGKSYSLAINQASNAIANQSRADVPEPGTLFLSALGLLAAGAGARRRLK